MDQNFLNFMQFLGKSGQICMLAPPPTRNPGSAPASVPSVHTSRSNFFNFYAVFGKNFLPSRKSWIRHWFVSVRFKLPHSGWHISKSGETLRYQKKTLQIYFALVDPIVIGVPSSSLSNFFQFHIVFRKIFAHWYGNKIKHIGWY